MSPVRVVLADRRRLIREALAEALGSHAAIDTVTTADDMRSAVLQAQRTQAVVVVVAGSWNGTLAQVCQELRTLEPAPRTLVLDGDGGDEALLHAIEAGADGYVAGASGIDALADAITAAARGESVVPPAMLGPLLRSLIDRQREVMRAMERLDSLTRRERQVLALMIDGLDQDRVADRLVISPETARTHVQRILRKLDVHSRLEAITLVARTGLADRLARVMEGRVT